MKIENPKISVIVPVYNVEKYLKECLDSIINQTYQNLEIICINDGSSDGSLNILNDYEQKDTRIRVYSKENGGLASARNEGLKYITGDYCHFLDSDDYIEPDLYNYAIKIFEKFDIDYFCFGSKTFLDDKNIVQDKSGIDDYISVKRNGVYDTSIDVCYNTNIHVWNKIFKTDFIKKNNIHFINGLLYEDIYFMWLYSIMSKRAYFDPKSFHNYRIRSSSIMEVATKNKSLKTGVDHLLNWYELYKTLLTYEELFNDNYDNLIQLLNLYAIRAKKMVPVEDQNTVKQIKKKYLKEIKNYRPKGYFLSQIFSIKNSIDGSHKLLNIMGLNLKFRYKRRK